MTALAPLYFLLDWEAPFFPSGACLLGLVILTACLAVWGCFGLRLVLVGTANQTLQATAR